MIRLLRRRGAAMGVLALAAVSGGAIINTGIGSGGGYLHANVSASPLLREMMSQGWQQLLQGLPRPLLSETASPGPAVASHLPIARSSPAAASGKQFPTDGGNPQCCPGCLGRNSISAAVAKVAPAVVNISNVSAGLIGEVACFFGLLAEKSIGCGTIIDPDGTILTCAHIVMDAQGSLFKRKVNVTLQDGRIFEGTVVNADFQSDIAVVAIKSKTALPTANFGASSELLPGDWVIALGCPLFVQNTVTIGIVSCVNRKSSDMGLGGPEREYLQTDCAINEGNSGGPLANLDGEVVGINSRKAANATGLSFAVPIDSVVKIVEQLKKNGRVVWPWLGLKMLDLNDMLSAHLKEGDISFPDVTKGVLVPVVTPGSPGERAGFHPGDVVIEFAGRPVRRSKEITDLIEDKVGVPIQVVVMRAKNQTVILTVVPEEAKPGL